MRSASVSPAWGRAGAVSSTLITSAGRAATTGSSAGVPRNGYTGGGGGAVVVVAAVAGGAAGGGSDEQAQPAVSTTRVTPAAHLDAEAPQGRLTARPGPRCDRRAAGGGPTAPAPPPGTGPRPPTG